MGLVYNFAVWYTQGGGLVRQGVGNSKVFVEAPNYPGLKVGDTMPDEWGLVAANRLAEDYEEMEDPLFEDLDSLMLYCN